MQPDVDAGRVEAEGVTSGAPEVVIEIQAEKRDAGMGAQDAGSALARKDSLQADGRVSTPRHRVNFPRRRGVMSSARSRPAHHQVGQEESARGGGRLAQLRAGTQKRQGKSKSEILQARGWESWSKAWDSWCQTLEPWVKG